MWLVFHVYDKKKRSTPLVRIHLCLAKNKIKLSTDIHCQKCCVRFASYGYHRQEHRKTRRAMSRLIHVPESKIKRMVHEDNRYKSYVLTRGQFTVYVLTDHTLSILKIIDFSIKFKRSAMMFSTVFDTILYTFY